MYFYIVTYTASLWAHKEARVSKQFDFLQDFYAKKRPNGIYIGCKYFNKKALKIELLGCGANVPRTILSWTFYIT